MATYSEDFGGVTHAGAITGEFTSRWSGAGAAFNYRNARRSLYPGGGGIRKVAGSDARTFYSYDAAGSVGDQHVLALVRISSLGLNEFGPGVVLRGGGSAGSEDGYVVGIVGQRIGADEGLVIWKYTGGSFTSLAGESDPNANANTWYWIEAEAVGTTIRARYWELGDARPAAWLHSVTDSDHSTGRVGVGTVEGTGTTFWGALRVGTEGSAAPDGPIQPVPPRVCSGSSTQLETQAFCEPGFLSDGESVYSEQYFGTGEESSWDRSQFRIRPAAGGSWTESSQITVNLPVDGYPCAVFGGLSADTEYEIQERRRDSIETEYGPWSPSATFTTSVDVDEGQEADDFAEPNTDPTDDPPPLWENFGDSDGSFLAGDDYASCEFTAGDRTGFRLSSLFESEGGQRIVALIRAESASVGAVGVHLKDSQGYFAEFRIGSTPSFRLFRWDGAGSRTVLGTSIAGAWSVSGPTSDLYYFLEVESDRDTGTVRARFWAPGETPPTWGSGTQEISATDATYDEGYQALFQWQPAGVPANYWHVHYVLVDGPGVVPPEGPVEPTVNDVTLNNPTSGIVEGSTYASHDDPAPAHTASRIRIALRSDPTTYLVDEVVEDGDLENVQFSGVPHDSELQVELAYKDANENWSPFSDPFEFDTPDADAPDQPTIYLNDSAPEEADIRATPVPPTHEDAGTDVTTARWQVDLTSSAFENLVADVDTEETSGDVTLNKLLLFDLDYSIQVWVRMAWLDEFGVQGPWSNTLNFTSEAEPPDAPDAPTISAVSVGLHTGVFASSAYSSPVGSPQQASQWQATINSEWQRPSDNDVTTTPGEWVEWTTDMLIPDYVNQIRKRDQDAAGRWGEWSNTLNVQTDPIPFPVKLSNPVPGDPITGVVDLEWAARPDDPLDAVYHAQYSLDQGDTWETLFEDWREPVDPGGTFFRYQWDVSDFDEQIGLYFRIWWSSPIVPFSRPASFVFHVDHGTGFVHVADLDDEELFEELWHTALANWNQTSLWYTLTGTGVETNAPTNNPWTTSLASAFGYDGLLDPDGAEVICVIKHNSGDPGPSFASDGLRYLPRMDQEVGISLMSHGTVAPSEEAIPYDWDNNIGFGGIELVFKANQQPWPYGWKPCGIFPNWRCGIWSPEQGRQRGTAACELILRIQHPDEILPVYQTSEIYEDNVQIEFVETYQSDYEMTCLGLFDNDCIRPDDGDLFRASIGFALRLRVETLQVRESGNRDFRIRAAINGPGFGFQPQGWWLDATVEDVEIQCGVPALVGRIFQWFGSPSVRYEQLSIIPFSYNGCDEPSVVVTEEPDDFVCPPQELYAVTTMVGQYDGGNLYLTEQALAEETTYLQMDLKTAPLAPAGAGGECVFLNFYVVLETRGTAFVQVTPWVNGEQREECQLEFEIDHTSAPHVRRYEVSLLAPWPSAANPRLTAALRGTWIQCEIVAYSLECDLDLTLHGVDVEIEQVRESHIDYTDGVGYTVLDTTEIPEPRAIRSLVGETEGGGILEVDQTSADDGSAYESRVVSAPLAPFGPGGESVFDNLYIQLTRRNTGSATLQVTPIVDEVEQETIAVPLAGVTGTRREVIEVSLFQKYSLDGSERSTYVPRGVWFQVKLSITDTDAPHLVAIDGVELEIEKVRESEDHAN